MPRGTVALGLTIRRSKTGRGNPGGRKKSWTGTSRPSLQIPILAPTAICYRHARKQAIKPDGRADRQMIGAPLLESKRVLALIPTRGGSKGTPRKNIQGLGGHPLIWHSIQAALGSAYVDDCFVSTDDEEIAEVACACGAWVPFLRPAELAQGGSKTIDCTVEGLARLAEMGRH